MKILILGAGATGQVYGRAFQRAGLDVSFFVKDKYLREVQNGFLISNYHRGKLQNPELSKCYSGYSELSQVDTISWDYVFLSISSTALYQSEVKEFLKATVRTHTQVITIQPGIEDEEYLLTLIQPTQMISLVVSFVSFRIEQGLAVYFPPFAVAKISSVSPELSSVAQLLERGGIRSQVVASARREIVLNDVILNVFIYCLERSGWKIDKLFSDREKLNLMLGAMREAIQAMSKKIDKNASVEILLTRKFLFKAVIEVIRRFVPFDFETVMKVHFSRNSDQTKQKLNYYLKLAKDYQLPNSLLEQLTS